MSARSVFGGLELVILSLRTQRVLRSVDPVGTAAGHHAVSGRVLSRPRRAEALYGGIEIIVTARDPELHHALEVVRALELLRITTGAVRVSLCAAQPAK
jgi:hypothetical protein